MINIYLTAIIFYLGMKRQEKPVLIFCVLTGFFNTLGIYIPNELGTFYYLGAAITDLLIIEIIYNSEPADMTYISIDLQNLCKSFICLNFGGWVLFMLYLNPFYYNLFFTLMYIYTIVVIIKGSKNDGIYSMGVWVSGFRGNHNKSNSRF